MAGLISSPAAPVDPAEAQVVADDWFPPVALADVRAGVRLGDGIVTTARLTAAIEGGMVHAFRELADWRSARVLGGAGELADVTALTINDKNYAELLWLRIVRYFAGAELAAQYRDITATDQGLDRAREKDEASDELRRLALAACTDLLSLGGTADAPVTPVARNRVELI